MKKVIFYIIFAIVAVVLAYRLNNKVENWYYTTPNPIVSFARTINEVVIGKKSSGKLKSRGHGKTDPISKDEEVKVDLTNHFYNDVHLDIGVYNSFIPLSTKYLSPKVSVGVSLFSYGNKYRDRWRFVRIGVGGMPNSGVDVTLSPAMYNVGNKIPVFSNTYVHPYVGYNVTNGVPILGLQLSLSF